MTVVSRLTGRAPNRTSASNKREVLLHAGRFTIHLAVISAISSLSSLPTKSELCPCFTFFKLELIDPTPVSYS